jgi:hypothetical protein
MQVLHPVPDLAALPCFPRFRSVTDATTTNNTTFYAPNTQMNLNEDDA